MTNCTGIMGKIFGHKWKEYDPSFDRLPRAFWKRFHATGKRIAAFHNCKLSVMICTRCGVEYE